MDELNLDKEHMNSTFARYEPLLCDKCRKNLRIAATPFAEKLNAGKRPSLREAMAIMNALCGPCTARISHQKSKEGRA